MARNEGIIGEFIAAWSRLDVDELVSYFSEDGVYHNMPYKPVQGHPALKVHQDRNLFPVDLGRMAQLLLVRY